MARSAVAVARQGLRRGAPQGYRWWRHVLLIALSVGTLACIALSAIDAARWYEWLALLPIALAILFGEWASHRYTMHRKVFPVAVYRRHVVEHHGFFSFDEMYIDDADDLRWVLFPPWAILLMIAAVLPIFAALHLLSANLAWIFALAVVGYYGIYEVIHALTHLRPPDNWLGRAIAAVSYHHRVHHDPALMKRWNFNFAVPLFDWLCGTRLAAPDAVRRSRSD